MRRRPIQDIDLELAQRLKQVRADAPRQDPRRSTEIRETVLARARQRTIIRFAGSALAATAITVAVLAMPAPATYNRTFEGPPPIRTAVGEPAPDAADPWVVASRIETAIEGDGWVPRHVGPQT